MAAINDNHSHVDTVTIVGPETIAGGETPVPRVIGAQVGRDRLFSRGASASLDQGVLDLHVRLGQCMGCSLPRAGATPEAVQIDRFLTAGGMRASPFRIQLCIETKTSPATVFGGDKPFRAAARAGAVWCTLFAGCHGVPPGGASASTKARARLPSSPAVNRYRLPRLRRMPCRVAAS